MCGIIGSTHANPAKGQEMLETLKHRGPDAQHTWHDTYITLGHALLAIRADKQNSTQPVTTPESPWVLIFNGQLYNTTYLKTHIPRTYQNETLDTTILFALINVYGWEFIAHIQGMFAIALYHKKEQMLRLYRDQSGQKPLYYTHNLPTFTFASEIDAILNVVSVPRNVDTTGLHTALSLGYIPGDRTLFTHIRKVRPGEVVTFMKNNSVHRSPYQSTTKELDANTPAEAITRTIQIHLAATQPVALNLSGGMDSSVLLHEMHALGHPLFTYTTRFDTPDSELNTDADLAQVLANTYHTDHTELFITSTAYRDALISACETVEEPNYNISLATYYLVAAAEGIHGKGHRSILTGDGGDEIFGGYTMYRYYRRTRTLANLLTPTLFNQYRKIRTGSTWDYGSPTDTWLSFRELRSVLNTELVKEYLREMVAATSYPLPKQLIQEVMHLDRNLWMAGENFIRSDKLYMHSSLEVRAPFAYTPLRAYFDAHLSNHDYFSESENKTFFRSLYREKLPPEIVYRKEKTGWRSPLTTWWDDTYRNLFAETFRNAPHGPTLDWNLLAETVGNATEWPGKHYHLYLSLAVLANRYKLSL